MARAVKVSVRTGVANALTARVYARGRKELRDVARINAGILRHPTFGRRGLGQWHDQRVRRGFVDRPVDKLADRILDESADAAMYVLEQIART